MKNHGYDTVSGATVALAKLKVRQKRKGNRRDQQKQKPRIQKVN
jgi:hypothetical protein